VTNSPPSYSDFIAPRYWPTWLGISLLCLAALMPFRLRMAAGAALGWLIWCVARERRYITAINIGICFPALDSRAQASLVKQSFLENGIGLVETACSWIRSPDQLADLGEMRGGKELQAALDLGKGILLMGGHYSTLDFAANVLSWYFPFGTTYRPHKNPLFDAFMFRGRLQNCTGVFDRKDIRGMYRHLKQGKILWYAPDQDYGPDQSVYAPFFGRPAATITAGSRFANYNKSPVFLVRHHRDTLAKRYVVETIPIPGFPTGDDVEDAVLINRYLESAICIAPAQYLWMHKRFKTNPGGKPESPYIQISTPNRKLSQNNYQQLTEGAQPVPGYADRQLLKSGLQLRTWPGLASGLWGHRHAAVKLDTFSKHLRSHGITTVTVDSVFRFPSLLTTGATCFVPGGTPVVQLPPGTVTPAHAAALLLRLHGCGCSFHTMQAASFWYTGNLLAVDDPLQLYKRPGTAAYRDRITDVIRIGKVLGLQDEAILTLQRVYLSGCRPGDRESLARLLAALSPSVDNTPVKEQDRH